MDSLSEKINSASVGTQVAAALETMGYHAMSGVIEQAEPMITAIAALLYVGALIAALISTALGGNYRSGLWFLIGPPLFYYTIMNQEKSDGASWKFGAFEDEGHKYVGKIVDADNAVDVPWLFKTYNEVISSLVQSVVKVVTNSDVKKQMMFMTRQRIMDGILRETPLAPGLESLIRFGTMGHCGKIMNAARELALVNRYELDTPETDAEVSLRTAGMTTTADAQAYARAIASYSQIDNLNVPLSKDPLSVQYVMQVLDGINNLEEEETKFFNLWCEDYSQNQNPANGLQATTKRDYYFKPENQLPASIQGVDRTLETRFEYPVSCGQVWCWMGMGLYQESKSIIDKTVERNKKPGFDEVDGLVGEILQNIAIKMTPPSKSATLEEDGPRRDSADFSRVEDASVIPIIISGILLKRKMQEDPRSQSLSQFAEHSGVELQPFRFSADMTSGQIEKAVMLGNQHTMAQSLQYEVFKFAYSIPYVQGMLLFGLSVLFPFFAILLVIPGKSHGFFAWFMLWAWAKSWDVGWAFVAVADDMIWSLMPHGSWFNIETDKNHGPITILESAFQHDSSYSLATYYIMLSTMLYAVPLVTGQFVLGAKAAVAGTMVNSVKSLGQNLGGAAGQYHAIKQIMSANKYGETARIKYLKNNMGLGKAAPQLASEIESNRALLQKAEGLRSDRNATWRNSHIAGGLTIAGAVGAAFIPGVGPMMSAALVSGVFTTGGAVTTGLASRARMYGRQALVTGRLGNQNLSTLSQLQADYLLKQSNYLPEAVVSERMRFGLSSRGQHWTVIQEPTHIPGQVLMMRADRENLAIYNEEVAKGQAVSIAKDVGLEALDSFVNARYFKRGR